MQAITYSSTAACFFVSGLFAFATANSSSNKNPVVEPKA
jgi:hypothetical protein